jgi:eukaryotic-like serine/threonine-protein kinase
MSTEPKNFYEFGPYRVDPEKLLLLRDNQPVALPPKAFETLLVLVRHSETVVLKDDLMKSIWPDTFVEESNLAQNIFVLRKTLGDMAGEKRYIATVPGRGYRFAEKVRVVSEQEEIVVDKDTIVLADFDNKTGDAVFDDTLKTALNVSLRQSPFLNMLSDSAVEKTLQEMTRPAARNSRPR